MNKSRVQQYIDRLNAERRGDDGDGADDEGEGEDDDLSRAERLRKSILEDDDGD